MNLNKIRNGTFLTLIVFILLNIFLSYKCYELEDIMKVFKKKDILNTQRMNLLIESVNFNLEFGLKIERNVISDDFFNLVQHDSGIFLKLSNGECSSCFQILSSILRDYKKSSVVIICSFDDPKDFQFVKNTYFPDYNLINFNSAIIDKEENKLINYFFTLDQTCRINNVFVFDKNFPKLTLKYLQNILK